MTHSKLNTLNASWSIALLLLMLISSCTKNTDRKLVWSDEFDYSGPPDTAKWDYDLGDGCPVVCGWGNNEAEFYTRNGKNVRVENGKLIIEAHHDSLSGKAYSSARIVTRHKGDWLYGRIEVKAKLPRGKGTWPAIWMLPTDWKYGGWPASGEIDIMEHVGFDPGVIHGTLHSESYNFKIGTQKEGKITVPHCLDQFHIYAVDWSENKIDFYVDEHLYHSVDRNAKENYKGWPFDQPFHLILNVAVGGDWGGTKGIDDSIWPQQMEIEYVRIFQ